MVDFFLELANSSEYATLETVGQSVDFGDEAQPQIYEIYALRVGYPDDVKPGILFNGGIHGREWLASESLIELARYLVDNAKNDETPVPWLLGRAPVWIIPMSNPAGRIRDDTQGGDPRFFYTDVGNIEYGWRHNVDIRQCQWGVDINRNFSHDWQSADDGCDSSEHYRGIQPFSTTEAVALRQFVLNHLVCMAVDVHTCSQLIWNRWQGSDKPGLAMKEEAAAVWGQGLGRLPDNYMPPIPLELLRLDTTDQTGTGSGQFTAWLGTRERGIQSFMLELPFDEKELGNYYDSWFQYEPNDGSNSFHPSDVLVREVIMECFIHMACYLIMRAANPSCLTALPERYVREEWPCTCDVEVSSEPHEIPTSKSNFDLDFAITAAKIGTDQDAPGKIECYSTVLKPPQSAGGIWDVARDAFNYLPEDTYQLFYWVQNNSLKHRQTSGVCDVRVRLQGRPDQQPSEPWNTLDSATEQLDLKALERELCIYEFTLEPGLEYMLSVEVRPEDGFEDNGPADDFDKNNVKVFAFTTVLRQP
jgi:hypothetical protein